MYKNSAAIPLILANNEIKSGSTKSFKIKVGKHYDSSEITMPVTVIRGKKEGPTLFVSAAIHGDEVAGTEIVKRLINSKKISQLHGTLIAIPIVNVFGYYALSRYLPDRRDLNRCFPGSFKGSLGGRIANLFLNEIVSKCDYGIDLHSGSNHRTNLPQIRAMIDDETTKILAEAFGTPVIMNDPFREGSLRQAASALGVRVLVYEGGESLRYSENIVRYGLNGTLSVMAKIGMIKKDIKKPSTRKKVFLASSSYWVRAGQGGSHRSLKKIGDTVNAGTKLGLISDSFANNKFYIKAHTEGIIIGQSLLPLAHKGDALFHIATFKSPKVLKQISDELDDYVDS